MRKETSCRRRWRPADTSTRIWSLGPSHELEAWLQVTTRKFRVWDRVGGASTTQQGRGTDPPAPPLLTEHIRVEPPEAQHAQRRHGLQSQLHSLPRSRCSRCLRRSAGLSSRRTLPRSRSQFSRVDKTNAITGQNAQAQLLLVSTDTHRRTTLHTGFTASRCISLKR